MPQIQTAHPEAAANAEDRLREAVRAAEVRSAEDQAALERVRRKLTRLMLVSLIITFIALAVVIIAVVYKITHSSPKAAIAAAPTSAAELTPEQTAAAAKLRGALIQTAPNSGADAYFARQKQEAEAKAAAAAAESAAAPTAVKNLSLPLAAGERAVSSSLSGNMLLLQTEGSAGGANLLIYDIDKGQIRARIRLDNSGDAAPAPAPR